MHKELIQREKVHSRPGLQEKIWALKWDEALAIRGMTPTRWHQKKIFLLDRCFLILLQIYLEKNRRLCGQARRGDNFTWLDGVAFYEKNYKGDMQKIIRNLQSLIDSGRKRSRLNYVKYTVPLIFKKLPVSLDKILQIQKCFLTTNELYTRDSEPDSGELYLNMLFTAIVLKSICGWLNAEKIVKEYRHIPEIGYYEEPPVSIDFVMQKYCKRTVHDVLTMQLV